jgi:hypothetical protein
MDKNGVHPQGTQPKSFLPEFFRRSINAPDPDLILLPVDQGSNENGK